MTSVLDHTSPTASAVRRRLGAAAAALTLLTTAGLLLDQSGSARGATAISLGTADGFAVLAGSGITNTGTTVIAGDIGTYPTTTITGDDAGQANDIVLTGSVRDDTVTASAKSGLLAAYDDAASQASTQAVTADLANPTATLTPGVYTATSSMGLTGALTLDAQGNPDAIFVFQAGSTLTTAPYSSVVLVGQAQACNVYWQVGSSATLDTGTSFVGTILAKDSITLNTGASVQGRVLARDAAVTLDSNVITRPACSAPTPTPTPAPVVDEPAGTPDATPGGSTTPSGDGSGRQVPRVPVGAVDAGGGSARGSGTGA